MNKMAKNYRPKKTIMDKAEMAMTIKRLAVEIVEKNYGVKDLIIVGIRTRGVYLAQRLVEEIKKVSKKPVPLGVLDITLYRDDFTTLSEMPMVKETKLPLDIEGKKIVLVDDVLFTGRTIRAAVDEIMDFGRPRCVQLAVLIDRGHRELPIQADFVGKVFKTSFTEMISVHMKEEGETDRVVLSEQEEKE